jgi:hypothetical protein
MTLKLIAWILIELTIIRKVKKNAVETLKMKLVLMFISV